MTNGPPNHFRVDGEALPTGTAYRKLVESGAVKLEPDSATAR